MTTDSEPRRRVREHTAARAALVVLAVAATFGLAVAAWPDRDPGTPAAASEPPPSSATTTSEATTTTIDTETLEAYLLAVQEAEAWQFVNAWHQAEQEAIAAEEARRAEAARLAELERQRAAAATTTTAPPAPAPVVTGGGSGCVIPAYICQRESGHNYSALNPSSGAGGMYQFMPSTWNGIARAINPAYVGTPPHLAPPAVQDQFATYLWAGGAGCGHWSAC